MALTIIVTKDLKHLMTFRQRVKFLSNRKWRTEAHRGVVDAGRMTKTKVQRAVHKQMAVVPGQYQGYVVKNTLGLSRPKTLSFDITARKKGAPIKTYKGLRALSEKGRAARRYNAGRDPFDQGFVRSGVWNAPRTFKRSFARDGGFFALRPSNKTSSGLPKEFWTFGAKPGQPRDSRGRFRSSGRRGFSVRRLFGPALGKELDKDLALSTFQLTAPIMLDRHVTPRIEKILSW